MNERIDQLWAQALDAAVPETYTRLSHSQVLKIKQVFAHMIVKECIATVEGISPGYKDYRDQIEDAFRRDCVLEIKQKFGVEE
jgi:hypothetical protein